MGQIPHKGVINILLFDSSMIKLNDGFTINDYIIRANADKVSYDKLCDKLNITFEEAKASYDKTWNLPIEAIGRHKPLEYLRTGTNWRCKA